MITYTKLDDSRWGIKGPESLMLDGGNIVVTKKNGEHKTESIKHIVSNEDGVCIAEIARQRGTRQRIKHDKYGTSICAICKKWTSGKYATCWQCKLEADEATSCCRRATLVCPKGVFRS
jgi:hypothetical protein